MGCLLPPGFLGDVSGCVDSIGGAPRIPTQLHREKPHSPSAHSSFFSLLLSFSPSSSLWILSFPSFGLEHVARLVSAQSSSLPGVSPSAGLSGCPWPLGTSHPFGRREHRLQAQSIPAAFFKGASPQVLEKMTRQQPELLSSCSLSLFSPLSAKPH